MVKISSRRVWLTETQTKQNKKKKRKKKKELLKGDFRKVSKLKNFNKYYWALISY